MSNMINGFLNISRLESGKIQLSKQPFLMGDLIKEAVGEFNLTGPDHQIEMKPCEKLVVQADRDKINSVVVNLLSNAFKYSPKGTAITIDCSQDGDQVKVSIIDEGLVLALKSAFMSLTVIIV